MTLFDAALREDGVILLDGGLATELESQGLNIDTSLWSASLLYSAPQAIIDAHRRYLEAGARCIVSASYQASREGFASIGLSAEDADQLIVSSVRLAQAAKQLYLAGCVASVREPMVAASVGPYGAMLHDGSEYRGGYAVENAVLRQFHAERLVLLDNAGADVLACETIPDYREAALLAELLALTTSPAWVSFACRDGRHISDGTAISRAARLYRGHPRVLAVGVNCTAPQHIASLIREVRKGAPDKAIVVYPNSGEAYNAHDNSWTGMVSPIDCASAAIEWRDAGAALIGGCCRMGPKHIAEMHRRLTADFSHGQ